MNAEMYRTMQLEERVDKLQEQLNLLQKAVEGIVEMLAEETIAKAQAMHHRAREIGEMEREASEQ